MSTLLGDVFAGFDEMDEDDLQLAWVRALEESKSLLNEIQAMVSDRTQKLAKGEEAAKLSAITRRKLKTMQDHILQLDQIGTKLTPYLTKKETGKRGEEIVKMKREVDSLATTMRKECRPPPPHLPGSPGVNTEESASEAPTGPRETQRSAQLNTPQLPGLQRQMIHEQDQQLDQLSQHIQRLAKISGAVNDEISVQNQMLDDLGDNMDKSSNKLKSSEKTIQSIEDDSLCVIS